MLRTGRNVEAFVGVNVTRIIADIVGVGIIGDGMRDIYIAAAHSIDDFDKPIEADPGIVVDGDTEILLDGLAAEIDGSSKATLADAIAMLKGFVQLTHANAGDIDIEVTRNGEHSDGFSGGVDGDNDVGLRKVDGRASRRCAEFLVSIAAKQENIDTRPAQDVAGAPLIGVFFSGGAWRLLVSYASDST